MSKPMPAHQFLDGNFAPWPMEGEIRDLPVEGEIPQELFGTYFRNGSNPQFAPGPNYHWFDGDGMIHAFEFEQGRCHYRNRWVRTERFELERKAGRALFAGLSDSEPDPRIAGVSPNTSNTNVTWHGGKLLSLWEGGAPYEIDPKTLETVGMHDYEGAFYRERAGMRMPDSMTAHPKPDPDTGEFIAFGYSPLAPHLAYHVVDADGKLTRSDVIDVPYPSMMHDFITTDQHAIFPVFPCVFDFANIEKTGSPLDWQPERGSHIGVMPRSGGNDDVVWVPHEPCMVFHPINAWVEDDGRVVAHVWQFPKLHLFPVEGGEKHIPGTLYRWTIDLAKRELVADRLDDMPADFGRIDQRYMGKKQRDVFNIGSKVPGSIGEPDSFDCIVHYDLETGKRKEHQLAGRGDSTGEPVFIPRSADAPEGDGFVIAVVHRMEGNHSEMLVLDAQNVEKAPLASVKLPHALPFGFHGNWMPGAG